MVRVNRLKALRIAYGYDSQRGLAEAINQRANGDKNLMVSYASIARMESPTANANPRWNIVEALSRFFHVTPGYLMGLSDEK